MKKILFFIFILFNTLVLSQVNRFYYELSYKPNKDSIKIEKMLTILDIKDDKSLYLNYELARYDSIIIASMENSAKFANFDWDNFYKNPPKNSIKIIKENGIITQKEYIGEIHNYNYKENIKLNWKLTNDKQIIENYSVQKATISFGGRDWIAWFTSEIPINDGPYKFFGLPGLIVKVEDSEKDYSWILKGNYLCQNDCNIPIDSYNERQTSSINISKDKLKQLKKKYEKDPLQGADVINPEINPSFFKEYKEELLKKINYYNNPIERD